MSTHLSWHHRLDASSTPTRFLSCFAVRLGPLSPDDLRLHRSLAHREQHIGPDLTLCCTILHCNCTAPLYCGLPFFCCASHQGARKGCERSPSQPEGSQRPTFQVRRAAGIAADTAALPRPRGWCRKQHDQANGAGQGEWRSLLVHPCFCFVAAFHLLQRGACLAVTASNMAAIGRAKWTEGSRPLMELVAAMSRTIGGGLTKRPPRRRGTSRRGSRTSRPSPTRCVTNGCRLCVRYCLCTPASPEVTLGE